VTLADYGIEKESTLHLFIVAPAHPVPTLSAYGAAGATLLLLLADLHRLRGRPRVRLRRS
jgi:hypothetical protein